jgi:hypothetical protein
LNSTSRVVPATRSSRTDPFFFMVSHTAIRCHLPRRRVSHITCVR